MNYNKTIDVSQTISLINLNISKTMEFKRQKSEICMLYDMRIKGLPSG